MSPEFIAARLSDAEKSALRHLYYRKPAAEADVDFPKTLIMAQLVDHSSDQAARKVSRLGREVMIAMRRAAATSAYAKRNNPILLRQVSL